MGMSFTFRCPACGHEVRSSGGENVLMRCRTTAILCRTCKEVQNVVTHSEELGNFPPREGGKDGAPLKCEVDPTHKVVRWSQKHPCPKCGKGMGMDDRSMILCD